MKQDLDSLVPTRDFSRRDFVATSVGGGFAAAMLPVSAQTIITPADGLTVGVVDIPAGDRSIPAYRSQPAKSSGKLPVVLVVSEIFGVHEYIADVTRRLAKQGYLAIAPEMFVRQGDAKSYTDIPRLLSEVVNKTPDRQVLGDLDATVAWAQANGGDTSRLGITGFCWGGRITWMYAAHSPAVKAAVAWYGVLDSGRFPGDRSAIDVAPQIKVPVLGLYGEKDGGIPLDTIDKMKAALSSSNTAAKASSFVVYPDAPHAFHADYRPSYRPEAAADGWKRALAWFKANGVA